MDRHADTGQAGLKALRGTPPDAIVPDLRLADMHGLEILRAVKEARFPPP